MSGDPQYSNVVLLLKGEGADGSTTIVDSSLAPKTITAVGGAQISAAQSKFGGSSIRFPSSTDYLSIAASDAFTFGTSDFTIECWVYYTSVATAPRPVYLGQGDVGIVQTYITSGGAFGCETGNTLSSVGGSFPLSQWNHIAVTRSGNTIRSFLNGTQVATHTETRSLAAPTTRYVNQYGAGGYGGPGYIDDLRITKGVARYTTNFTPPAESFYAFAPAPAPTVGDPQYPNVVLLLNGDGANGSTTIVDSSPTPKLVTVVGNTQISTAQSKFGGSSIYLDGAGDYLSVGSTGDPAFSFPEDFTIEAWVRLTSINSWPTIFASYGGSRSGAYLIYASGGRPSFYVYPALDVLVSSSLLSVGVWHHIAVTRSGTTCRMFIDGVQTASATYAGSLNTDPAHPSSVGAYWQASSVQAGSEWNGYIDDLRITKGFARYTTDFAPPTGPFPATGLSVRGMVYDASGNPAGGRTIRAYDRSTGALVAQTTSGLGPGDDQFTKISLLLNGDGADGSTVVTDRSGSPKAFTAYGSAQISTAQSKFGGSSMNLNGSTDYFQTPANDAFAFPEDFTIEFWALKSANGSNGYDTALTTDTSNGSASNGWFVELSPSRGFGMWYSGSSIIQASAASPNDGLWHHWAVTRSGSTVRAFQDGVLLASSTFSAAILANGPFGVGGSQNSYQYRFNGYIDDLRITKGVARYTANFTPPAASFPTNQTAALGSYTLQLSDGVYTLVCLDDDTSPDYNALVIDRAVPI